MDTKTLKEMRRKEGLSQWQVAVACDRTQGWLSNIELGYVQPTDEDIFNIIAAIKTLSKQIAAC